MKIKQHLIDEATRLTGIRKKDCAVIVDSLLELIAESMIDGEGTEIRGLGKFTSFVRTSRPRIKPSTGEVMPNPIPAMRIPRFTPSKILRQRTAEAFRKETGE